MTLRPNLRANRCALSVSVSPSACQLGREFVFGFLGRLDRLDPSVGLQERQASGMLPPGVKAARDSWTDFIIIEADVMSYPR